MHHPLDIIRTMLPIIPSLIALFRFVLKNSENSQQHKGYDMLCILLGFTFFPSNEYVGMTVGIFACCLIYLNYMRIHKGNQIGSLTFPCLFFFNLSSFSGVNKFENICMIIYAAVGGVYIAGLSVQKDDNNYLEKHEQFCITTSAIVFISIKIIFLIFTDTLIIQ